MKEDIDDIIANWVRAAREEAQLSGEQLGAALALQLGTERGHSKSNISHWELKKHQPSLTQLLAISRITGKPLPEELGDFLPPPKAQESLSLALVWVDPKELELITMYREADDMGRKMMEHAGQLAPKKPSTIRSVNEKV